VTSTNLHEDLSRATDEEKSSERALGITFAVVFALVAGWLFYKANGWWLTCAILAALFILLAYFWIAPLRPLNALWHRFGLLLFHVVNPVIMAIIFYVAVTPIGFLMRLFKKDPLRLELDRQATTYWQTRVPSAGVPQNMNKQF
jgi:hypothetical protein